MRRMHPHWIGTVFLATGLLIAQERLTPESLVGLRRVGEPALSAQGSKLAFTVRTVDLAQNRAVPMVWTLDLQREDSAPAALAEGSEPCWAPDGQSIAWLTKGGIQIRDLATGKDRLLALPGGIANLRWTPDGSRFVFTQDVKLDPDVHDRHPDLPKAAARVYDDLMVRHWDSWKDGTYSHIFTVPADGTGKPVDLMAGERVDAPLKPFGGKEQFCVSPDGKFLCYTAKRVADPERSTDKIGRAHV